MPGPFCCHWSRIIGMLVLTIHEHRLQQPILSLGGAFPELG
jgi:hypothetical protein